MVCEHPTDSCLSSQNGTAKDPRTHWRRSGTGAPPQVRRKQPTPEIAPPPPGMPLAPSGDKNHAQSSKMPNLPAGYKYQHTPLPGGQFFNPDTYARDSGYEEDFIPGLRNDEDTSTG